MPFKRERELLVPRHSIVVNTRPEVHDIRGFLNRVNVSSLVHATRLTVVNGKTCVHDSANIGTDVNACPPVHAIYPFHSDLLGLGYEILKIHSPDREMNIEFWVKKHPNLT